MNKTMLIGRLTSAPEISKTTNDKSYVRVTLAVNRRFKNEKGEREADFISIIIWGKSAETLVSYAKEVLFQLKEKLELEIIRISKIKNIMSQKS